MIFKWSRRKPMKDRREREDFYSYIVDENKKLKKFEFGLMVKVKLDMERTNRFYIAFWNSEHYVESKKSYSFRVAKEKAEYILMFDNEQLFDVFEPKQQQTKMHKHYGSPL